MLIDRLKSHPASCEVMYIVENSENLLTVKDETLNCLHGNL